MADIYGAPNPEAVKRIANCQLRHSALVCKECSFMSHYWDSPDVIWEKHIIDSTPISCKSCGIGEYKIVHDVKVDGWCDDCCKHRTRCKCQSVANY